MTRAEAFPIMLPGRMVGVWSPHTWVSIAAVLAGCARKDAPLLPQRDQSATRPAASAAPKPAPRAVDTVAPATPLQAPAPESSRARYDWDRTHSILTDHVVENLRRIAASNDLLRDNVFAKVGDSVSVSTHALGCFSKPAPRLGRFATLAPVIDHFKSGDAAGVHPFRRESEATRAGWSAWQVITAHSPPLEREINAIMPRIALVQFGTNDVQIGSLHHFADRMFEIVDLSIARGTIPVLFTIMPRTDRPAAAAKVPWYNAAIRVVAQARQIPLVDYHRELVSLPGYGLANDGIHPSVYRGQHGVDGCDLGDAALKYGFNVRNLLSLQALDRVTRVLGNAAPGVIEVEQPLSGSGTEEQPFAVPRVPFSDARRPALSSSPAVLPGACPASRTPVGAAVWYRIDVTRPGTLRVLEFDRGPGQFDIALFSAQGEGAPRRCIAKGERMLLTGVGTGRYDLVIYAAGQAAVRPGAEFALAILAE